LGENVVVSHVGAEGCNATEAWLCTVVGYTINFLTTCMQA
jgi:hypothetical protein